MRVEFQVFGVPASQGSKRHVGNGVMIESSAKLRPWRQDVAMMAHAAMVEQHASRFEGPVYVECHFHFQRPKSLARRIVHKTTRPDCDKLARAVFDSLTGTIIRDDSQVVDCHIVKAFGEQPRARIIVQEL